ncbi:MAG: N-acetyltransferase, partial [Anaerolineales bacterium]
EDEQRTLDVGVGLHPDHVGQGLGGRFVLAILKFGVVTYHPERFRATIAAFNQRSLKTFLHLGFRQVHQFTRESDGLPFVQIIAPAKSFDGSIYPGEQ